ncbi:hypothetical protein [Photobacterium damselae]|uniref:hypothetical protein n=1 Tax=Photobacterium damselae TaxID=38293 RepID=UPI001F42B5EA|nr:hypothetical protein [Photobacterium damselae]UKA31044.1 hypothetical protein IPQ37_20065 [Photobacterium damselae subsp. damselae]
MMSGGDWVCWAPEYFITSCLAQSLNQIQGGKYVTIENRAYDAFISANAVGKGRLHGDIRSNGRFDLLLWKAKGDPTAVIEVKNRVCKKMQYEADLKRIIAVLKRKRQDSTMEFGALAFYSATDDSPERTALEKLEQRSSTIEKNAKEIVGSDFCATLHRSKIKVEDKSAWFAGCILIEKKILK